MEKGAQMVFVPDKGARVAQGLQALKVEPVIRVQIPD